MSGTVDDLLKAATNIIGAKRKVQEYINEKGEKFDKEWNKPLGLGQGIPIPGTNIGWKQGHLTKNEPASKDPSQQIFEPMFKGNMPTEKSSGATSSSLTSLPSPAGGGALPVGGGAPPVGGGAPPVGGGAPVAAAPLVRRRLGGPPAAPMIPGGGAPAGGAAPAGGGIPVPPGGGIPVPPAGPAPRWNGGRFV